MAWLLAHMWAALAGVAVFGLLLGWSIRGMMLVGKMRRAMVERDVTQTELEQAKEEIESLYAAQRGQPVGNTNAREAQAEQNVKFQRMSDELSRAKSELEALKAKADEALVSGAKAAGAAGAGAVGTIAAVGGATDPNPALVWRNRHLESRVRHLEAMIGEGGSEAAGASSAEAAPVAPAAMATGETSDADAAKAEWQQNFLKQRVEALEDELAKVKAPAATPSGRNGNGEAEEELARLRWRNRFLEGRLAYFEGDQDAEEEGIEADAVAAAAITPEPLPDLPETEPESELESVPDFDGEAENEPEVELAEPEAEPSDEADFAEELAEDAEDDIEEAIEFEAEQEPEAPAELAADPDAEPDVPAFEIVDRFADEAPAEAETAFDDTELTPVEDELAEDYAETAEVDADDEVPADGSEEETDIDRADEASRAILAALELTDEEDEASDNAAELGVAESESAPEDEADFVEADTEEANDDSGSDETAEEGPAGVQPMALDKPVANTPDDLTIIGGVGPKIQEVLNSMGIWHYDQIAAWTPENVTWVDHELNFSGRITREGWVQQAAILAGDTVDEDA